jgi:tripartite-type tricarboxylate transporter receptor subunit TctC
MTACGGNVNNDDSDGAGGAGNDFPTRSINLAVGQDAGGSTDLIARALAEPVSDELAHPMVVVNKPGANGALAAGELASTKPDGYELMVINASLIAITSIANPEDAVELSDFTVVTGVSLDDYVLISKAGSGLATVDDLARAGRTLNFGTTGVGTGSQLSQELLFKQAKINAKAVPFNGGAPTLTAVLGGQVDVGSVQLGEAMPQIKAGAVTPIVTFSQQRNQYLPDTPTAKDAGFDVPVAQARAIVAPAGTPDAVIEKLRAAFQTAFQTDAYKKFNEAKLLTPHEVDGEQLAKEWSDAKAKYEALVAQYGIDLAGGK